MRSCPQETIYSWLWKGACFPWTYNNAITSGFKIKRYRVAEKKEPSVMRIRGLTETG